jgi:hypothetical protein
LEGRDSVAKGLGTGGVTAYYGDGPVVSIAQLVRNDKLDPQHMNKIKRFPDGTSILSPNNRSWKSADTAWRPETPRGVYPQNNPTYHRTPGSSPRRTPQSAPRMNYSASAGRIPPHDVTQLGQSQQYQQYQLDQYAQQQHHHQQQQQHEYEQHAQASAGWSSSRAPGSPQEHRAPAAYQPAPIFDKLTDPNLYTGTHRQRFDEESVLALGVSSGPVA